MITNPPTSGTSGERCALKREISLEIVSRRPAATSYGYMDLHLHDLVACVNELTWRDLLGSFSGRACGARRVQQ